MKHALPPGQHTTHGCWLYRRPAQGQCSSRRPGHWQTVAPTCTSCSVGVASTASYDLNDDFTFHLRGGWDRLIGDAADSPIVKEGSTNQFYGGAGISYEFGFSLD